MQRFENLIGGRMTPAASGRWMASLDPYKNENWCEVPDSDQGEVDAAVAAAKAAFHSPKWAKMSATARGALLRRVGDLIAENADRLAEIEVRDNGKLLGEMRIQLQTIPQWYYYYAGLADKIEGAVLPIDKPDQFVFTRWEPLGVVAAITAWNSPLLLLTWKLAPGLAAGNTFILKPSEFTSASTVAFAELFELAGFPPGVVNVVCGTGQNVGAPSSATLTSPRSPSPVPTRPGRRSTKPQPGTSSRSRWNWAGSRPISFSKTRISTPRWRAWRRAFSRRRARLASPGRDCCCNGRSTTRSSRSSGP